MINKKVNNKFIIICERIIIAMSFFIFALFFQNNLNYKLLTKILKCLITKGKINFFNLLIYYIFCINF